MNNLRKTNEIIQKLENIVYKLRYVLEFIFSLISIFGIYKLVTIKHYFGYYHKTYLTLATICTMFALAILIYCCIKDREKIEKIFLTFMIPVGIFYIAFIIPSYAPDEQAHMWKAYEISTGKLITTIESDGSSHTEVPTDLLKYQPGKVAKYLSLIGQVNGKTNYNHTTKKTSSAQNYSFILYLGSALGFVVSRFLGLNILIGILLGKIFNFILFLVVGYYVIKIIPFGKILMASYLFMPMVLQQATSFSADAITNIVMFLFIAYVLKLVFQKEKITLKQDVALFILSILVGIVKIVYIPILGLILMLAFKKNMTKKEKAIVLPICIIVGAIVAVAMYLFSTKYISTNMIPYYEENNVKSSEQIHYIMQNPIEFAKIVKNDWVNKSENYINMLIGSNLGWLNIYVNKIIIYLFLIFILFSITVEKNENVLNKKQKIWTILLGIATIIAIEIAMYISWSGVGTKTIEGIQGRYFIPVGIVLLLTICMKNNYLKFKNINIKILTVLSILNIFAIQSVYLFFA